MIDDKLPLAKLAAKSGDFASMTDEAALDIARYAKLRLARHRD